MSLPPKPDTSARRGEPTSDLPREAPHAAAGAAPQAGGTVVIVEDNQHTAKALCRVLERAGYATRPFLSAAEVRGWLDAGGGQGGGDAPIVAAVIDVHLPDGDGVTLSRDLRAGLGDGVPILVVSGDTSMETLRRLEGSGADRFIGKPVSLEALLEPLRERPT